jgi:hypothetical protein
MTGLIWFVHVVHYPTLYRPSDAAGWYGREHISRTVRVVAPVMTLEAITAVLLFPLRPAYVPNSSVWLGLALLAAIWLMSFLILLPRHFVLARGFDPSASRTLMKVNAARTALWTARSVLVLWMLVGGLSATLTR